MKRSAPMELERCTQDDARKYHDVKKRNGFTVTLDDVRKMAEVAPDRWRQFYMDMFVSSHTEAHLPLMLYHDHARLVLEYLEGGKTTDYYSLESGLCTGTIQALGLESAFHWNEEGTKLLPEKSVNQIYLEKLQAFPPLLAEHLEFVNERKLLANPEYAANVSLIPFTPQEYQKAVVHNPEILAGHKLLVLDNPEFDGPPFQVDFEDLNARIAADLGTLHQDMPWVLDCDAGITIAGGYIESMIRKQKPRDIDLFVVVPPAGEKEELEIAMNVINRTIAAICRHSASVRMVCLDHVINLYTPTHTFQIVNAAYYSPAQVVGGFDIDSCRLAFNGTQLLAHFTAMRAWKNGWNVFTPITLSKSAIHRYFKKYRAGMGILVVGVSTTELNDMIEVASLPYAWELVKKTWRNMITIDKLVLQITNPRITKEPAAECCDYADNWDEDSLLNGKFHRSKQLPNLFEHQFHNEHRGVALARNRFDIIREMFTGSYHPVYSNIYVRNLPTMDSVQKKKKVIAKPSLRCVPSASSSIDEAPSSSSETMEFDS